MPGQLGIGNFAKHDERFPYKYRAKVEDNVDPEQYGRIKARVYPMFAGIKDKADIPWAVPEFPLGVGAGAGFGTFSVPEIGTYVWVFFEMGDIYQPVYGGAAPTALSGLPDQRTVNYPATKVYRTENGIQVTINDYNEGGSDQRLYRIDHPKGAVIELVPDGSINIHTEHRNIVLDPHARVRITAPKTRIEGNVYIDSGASGVFFGADGSVITVDHGIITDIE